MSRPAMSVTPPAGNGTMILTGLFGYCCAQAAPGTISAAQIASARMIVVVI